MIILDTENERGRVTTQGDGDAHSGDLLELTLFGLAKLFLSIAYREVVASLSGSQPG